MTTVPTGCCYALIAPRVARGVAATFQRLTAAVGVALALLLSAASGRECAAQESVLARARTVLDSKTAPVEEKVKAVESVATGERSRQAAGWLLDRLLDDPAAGQAARLFDPALAPALQAALARQVATGAPARRWAMEAVRPGGATAWLRRLLLLEALATGPGREDDVTALLRERLGERERAPAIRARAIDLLASGRDGASYGEFLRLAGNAAQPWPVRVAALAGAKEFGADRFRRERAPDKVIPLLAAESGGRVRGDAVDLLESRTAQTFRDDRPAR
ncbi:MAG: hypothetical protein HY719_08605 [Planctomycetes bacterium]|nr:hypothetical protein [Planctomycetota bacterium]